jgi:hypothetical protein
MTRVRGWAVVLGGASALAFAFVDPRFSQFALISIPFWRRLLQARLKQRYVAVYADGSPQEAASATKR